MSNEREKLAERLEKMHGRDLTLFLGMGEFRADTTDVQKRAAILALFCPRSSQSPDGEARSSVGKG
jgi:hypothetical protein